MSIDQAVRYLENKPMEFDLAPKIQPLTPEYLPKEVITDSLSPAEYRPVFNVENHDVAH
jgi:periplasmic protein TorT